MIEFSNLSYNASESAIVSDANFKVDDHALTVIVGPNGAGKTTLLKLALGTLQPSSGCAKLNGVDVTRMSFEERARKISYLPQHRPLIWPQPVKDVVALGRFAYGGSPGRLSDSDTEAVNAAIDVCGLSELEDRAADTLSGGELARTHLARALASQAPTIIADEPIAALDPRYQHEILQIFTRFVREGHTVLTVLHDLPLAARYADRLIWMHEGRIIADGTPEQTITTQRLREVFGINAKLRQADNGDITIDIIGPG